MLHTKKLTPYAFILGLFLIATGCSDSSTGTETTDFDASAILQNEANSVILETYINLDTEAGALLTAVNTLQSSTTAANLEAAQDQWRNTREPWENSESFLFGPVDDDGIDPSIDDWPLNKTDLDNVLSSSDNLDKEYIDGLETSLKGFHTIEYLLFGDSNDKTPAEFTAREFEYLIAATQSLKGETSRLVTLWQPNDGNFVDVLANAGNGSDRYTSQRGALGDLIDGMEGIANEVATGKIGGPFSESDPDIARNSVESQFSFNSKTDFQNNIRSIMHIYTGDYEGSNGPGVSDFVVEFDADLDVRFKQEIDAAITAIGNIQGNFRSAIIDNPDDVEAAQEAVLTISSTLQQDITPLLNNI